MTAFLSEKAGIVTVLQPDADAFAGTKNTDIVNLSYFRRATFLVSEGAGGTGTTKITVEACSDKAGTGATAIPFRYRLLSDGDYVAPVYVTVAATGYTTVAGANKLIAIEVEADELPDGKPYCRLTMVEAVDSPVDGCVHAILTDPSYNQQLMPNPLS